MDGILVLGLFGKEKSGYWSMGRVVIGVCIGNLSHCHAIISVWKLPSVAYHTTVHRSSYQGRFRAKQSPPVISHLLLPPGITREYLSAERC